jgi:3-hydroxyacyl-CoA dehydrogenase
MHFMNPPVLMPLVELIRGLETSDATVSRAHCMKSFSRDVSESLVGQSKVIYGVSLDGKWQW